jgi:predicted DNA-binding transcriptional regulator YafY
MFSLDELEALALGSRWVAQRGDERLAQAARDAMARIGAVLPAELRHELDSHALLVGPGKELTAGDAGVAMIRLAIRHEHKLQIDYRDGQGRDSRRVIWPFALGYFDHAQVIVAWCEQRDDVRHFRTDRITALQPLKERYPQRRQALLKAWRVQQGLAEP